MGWMTVRNACGASSGRLPSVGRPATTAAPAAISRPSVGTTLPGGNSFPCLDPGTLPWGWLTGRMLLPWGRRRWRICRDLLRRWVCGSARLPKEKVKAAPKVLVRRGLDDGTERLRGQLRETAQRGQASDYGGDRIEDTAARVAYQGCEWAGPDQIYIDYHDNEWGQPLHDDNKLFEMLILEGMQAGLAWITVLKKREAFCAAFDNFDPPKVALYAKKNAQ